MFCPKCRSEYRDGYTICPDCNEELVDQLPEEEIEEVIAIKPVKLKSVANEIEAELILNLLQNNNIPCFKKNKGVGGYMSIYMGYSIYGEDIYVDENDYTKALDILNNLEPDPDSIDEEDSPTDHYHVPFYKNPHIVASILLIIIVGFIIFGLR